jgi:hypothetical protein
MAKTIFQDTRLEMLLETFPGILQDAASKYELRMQRYGDSWKTRAFEDIQKHLRSEVAEYFEANTAADQYGEVIDIINVALILAMRLRSR